MNEPEMVETTPIDRLDAEQAMARFTWGLAAAMLALFALFALVAATT